MNNQDEVPGTFIFGISAAVLIAFIAVVALGMWGCPRYKVYSKRKHGEAVLAEAQSTRMARVIDAKARREAAQELAIADTLRAVGVAQTNRIIGHSLRDNPEYLTWLWVEALKEGGNSVIYVPTEAQLPLLEAGRLGNFKRTAPQEAP